MSDTRGDAQRVAVGIKKNPELLQTPDHILVSINSVNGDDGATCLQNLPH